MKTVNIFIALLFVGFFSYANSNTFEGILTLSEEGSSSRTVDMAIKNNKIAMQLSDNSKVVLDLTTGYLFSQVDQGGQKMVVKMNIKSLSSIGGVSSFFGGPYSALVEQKDKGNVEVQLTGESKTINGYKCNKVILTSDDSESTLWVTKDIPFNFFALLNGLAVQESLSAINNTLPLKGEFKDLKTGDVSGFSIVVQAKTLDDGLFSFPADYLVMDMTPLIQQMIMTSSPEDIKKTIENFIPR